MRPIVAVLLGCYGPNDREKDIQQLVEWYVKSKSATNKQPTEASELKMISPEKATVTEIQKSTLELR